jgi:hypothetical protein
LVLCVYSTKVAIEDKKATTPDTALDVSLREKITPAMGTRRNRIANAIDSGSLPLAHLFHLFTCLPQANEDGHIKK